MTENLFLRLEKYTCNSKTSRENLFTEVIAYLLDSDKKFKKSFLNFILKKRDLIKKFMGASITTQRRMSEKSIIDIAFCAPNGNSFYIENKINSPEGQIDIRRGQTQNQIAYYLGLLHKGDCLAYLTPKNTSPPFFRKTTFNLKAFRGQYYWEDIYRMIARHNISKKDHLFDLVLKYMEESGMKGNDAFTKQELNTARNAFSFILKTEDLLEGICAQLTPLLNTAFGPKLHTSGIHQNFKCDEVYYRCKRKQWKFGIYLGISINSDKIPSLDFGPGAWGKQIVATIKEDEILSKEVQTLSRLGWEIWDSDTQWWETRKHYPIKSKSPESLQAEMLPKLKKAITELKSSRIIRTLANRSLKFKI